MPLYQGSRRLALLRKPTLVTTTTLDPVNSTANQVLSLGNLKDTGGANGIALSIAGHSSGKYYWEVTTGAVSNTGLGALSAIQSLASGQYISGSVNSLAVFSSGWNGAGGGITTSPANVAGHTYGLALDVNNRTIWIIDWSLGSPTWNANGTANPATNTNGAILPAGMTSGVLYAGVTCAGAGDNVTFNFGATAYVGTPPSGFGNW